MTIAIGILSPSCVLLAADSEETTLSAGDLKSSVGKIGFHSSIKFDAEQGGGCTFNSIAMSGAGDSAYLAALKQHLVEDFASVKQVGEFDGILRNRIRNFYEEHVMPFTDLDLRVNVIVTACCGADQRLWVTNLTTVRSVNTLGICFVGSGDRCANTAIGPTVATTDHVALSIVAAFGIFFAKEYAGGCGKQTHIVLIGHNLPPILARREALDSLDSLFRRYEGFNAFMRYSLLGVPTSDGFTGIETKLGAFRKEVEEISRVLYPASPLTPAVEEKTGTA